MTILERAPDLARKLSSTSFSESTVRYDVVKHLATVDILVHHIIVMLQHAQGQLASVEREMIASSIPGTRSYSSYHIRRGGEAADLSLPLALCELLSKRLLLPLLRGSTDSAWERLTSREQLKMLMVLSPS